MKLNIGDPVTPAIPLGQWGPIKQGDGETLAAHPGQRWWVADVHKPSSLNGSRLRMRIIRNDDSIWVDGDQIVPLLTEHYLEVEVPEVVRANWDQPEAEWWRRGVRAAAEKWRTA